MTRCLQLIKKRKPRTCCMTRFLQLIKKRKPRTCCMTRFLQLLKKRKQKDKDKVGKTMDIIVLLQAIFVILLVGDKTLHEQSLLIARLSELFQPCLLNHLQSEDFLSPSSPCCCQSQTRRCDITTPMLDKVTRTEIVAHARFAWLERTLTALCFVSEVVVGAGAIVGQVVYQALYLGPEIA